MTGIKQVEVSAFSRFNEIRLMSFLIIYHLQFKPNNIGCNYGD